MGDQRGRRYEGRNQRISVNVFPHRSFQAIDNLRKDGQMITRIATSIAFALTLVSPAFSDCSQELKALEQNVVSAGTGASTSVSGMPATKHQEELLAGQQKSGEPKTTGSTAVAVEPTSPHQEQVTKQRAQGAEHANQLMAEARKMSEAGDEQGCMKKVGELKNVLGTK
jgi:hypothetical protein